MTERLDVSRVWASGDTLSSIIDPGSEKYSLGWIAEIPSYQNLNFLQYRTDRNLRALAERGIFEWGTDVEFMLGSLTWDNGVIYINVTGNYTTSKPSSDSTNWKKSAVSITDAEWNALNTLVNSHRSNTANPHKVTAAQIGSLTEAQINALVNEVQSNIDAHIARTNNPHAVTAVQAGAVPKTGGDYTGLVNMQVAYTQIGKGNTTLPAYVDARGGEFGFRYGTNFLGIDEATAKAVYNGSPLLVESQYLEYKEQTEADFATPTPDFHLPLMGDTNIYNGVGTTAFTGTAGEIYAGRDGQEALTTKDAPAFGKYGLFLTTDSTLLADGKNLATGDFTFVIDVYTTNNTIPTDAGWLYFSKDNSGSVPRIVVTSAGRLEWRSDAGSNVNLGNLDLNTPNRYCVVYSGSTLTTYKNGAVVTSATVPTQVLSAISFKSVSTALKCYTRNIRYWNIALTPEQISTL